MRVDDHPAGGLGELGNKRFDKITVQEIAEQANVGRSTYYAHFEDKEDLIVESVRMMLADLEAATTAPERTARLYPTLALFQHVEAHIELYEMLARGRALNLFVEALHTELAADLRDRLEARVAPGEKPAVPLHVLAPIVASMLVTTIRIWVEDGKREHAEAIDRHFQTVAGPSMRAGLRTAS